MIADQTDKNVNVFWELGVRQSFKHGTITIAEEGTKLPFDVFAKSTLEYNIRNPSQIANFKEQFKKAIQDYLSNPKSPDSHVLETLSGRGTLFEIFRRDETMRRLDAILLECDMNLGILEILIKVCEENKGKDKEKDKILKRMLSIFSWHNERSFNVSRLGSTAIELLVTHRYLDKTNEFYISAETYRRLLEITNHQLENWPSNQANTEEWIFKNKNMLRKAINDFKTVAKTAHDDINTIVK